jgi:hypothetical protein
MKQKRWMKSVIVESAKPGITLPWHRGARQSVVTTRQIRRVSGTPANR